MRLPPTIPDDAVALLAALIRIDTSNPPGREAAAAELLAQELRRDGYEPVVREAAPGRSNLIIRRKGDGTGGGPLMLTGHLDVVPADASAWKHPPFAADVADGWLWGRGAVDMKNHLAACAMVMRQLAREDVRLKRDVIFAAVADEEAGCRLGSQFLVDEHPDLVRAEWALGEVGGFTVFLGGRRLYPIQVAHKGAAWLTMRARGTAGHGSIPREDSAPQRLARAIMRLGNMPLPVHVCAPTRRMLDALSQAQGLGPRLAMTLLQRPALTDFVLQSLVTDEKARRMLGAVLRNTAAATELRAGQGPNVLPPFAEATVDGRLLPGQASADLLRELAEIVDDEQVTFEVRHEIAAGETPSDTLLYRKIEETLRAMDPDGVPFPQIIPGFTDASAFAKLGVRTYGFTPMVLPDGKIPFADLPHGVDERIPIEGFKTGVQALWDLVLAFCA